MTNVLLDTCALLWLAAGDSRLSVDAKTAISEAPLVYVSVVSAFEIALKETRGKLELPAQPEEWFETIVSHHGLTVQELTLADSLRAPQLPDIHRDPCDRFIVATSLRLGTPVVTPDEHIAQYDVRVIR
jgi:PIN domain nuclease of toxin-antitoxin system